MKAVDSGINILDIEGVKLSYIENGTGPKVILIHGSASDYRIWGPLFETLSKHFRTVNYNRRCATPNQNSDYTSSTIENNMNDLTGLIIKTGGGPVHLIGHSYGGTIAAYYALKQPKLIGSIVLIEPWLPKVLGDPNSAVQRLSLLLRKPSVAKSAQKSVKNTEAVIQELDRKDFSKAGQLFYDGLWERQDMKLQLKAEVPFSNDNVETIRELYTKSPPFTKEDARRISQPTLLLTGEYSIKVVKGILEELHNSIPNNQLVTIRNAAHMPFLESPKDCNEAILRFLVEHAA